METYDNASDEEPMMSGGASSSMSLKSSFFDYITTITPNEKTQLMNLIQYGGLTILPILLVLKLMKLYVPSEDPFKASTELVIEVLVQLIVIVVSFFFIHKLVVYLPTYSGREYDKFSLLSGLLPLFFLMFTLDTKLGEKLNILLDRLLFALGIKKEPFEDEEEKNKPKEGMRPKTTTMTQAQSGASTSFENRMIDGFPTKREPMVSMGDTNPMMPSCGGEMFQTEEPMAANSVLGGSAF
jgi:hypothetical protein